MDKLKAYRLPPATISVNDYVVVANTILGTQLAGMRTVLQFVAEKGAAPAVEAESSCSLPTDLMVQLYMLFSSEWKVVIFHYLDVLCPLFQRC